MGAGIVADASSAIVPGLAGPHGIVEEAAAAEEGLDPGTFG